MKTQKLFNRCVIAAMVVFVILGCFFPEQVFMFVTFVIILGILAIITAPEEDENANVELSDEQVSTLLKMDDSLHTSDFCSCCGKITKFDSEGYCDECGTYKYDMFVNKSKN